MTVESERDLAALRRVGRVVGLALREMRESLEPGMTTGELDAVGARVFERHGARSAPQLMKGFPGVNCISVNDEAVHGIPGNRVVEPGDLKIDVTAELAFERAASVARAGRPLNKIGRVVETAVRRRGFTVMTELRGHGVGRAIHEPPTIPNHYERRLRAPLREGLVITIEPIISSGSGWTIDGGDGWTIKTSDGSPVAHHEHTIVVTKGRPLVLTAA